MKKKIITLLLLLLIITGCGKKDETDSATKSMNAQNEIKETMYEYLITHYYLDDENISSFEINTIYKKGYYKSNKDIYYLQFYCNYECKDGTDSCILNNKSEPYPPKWLFETEDNEEGNYTFSFEYDIRNNKVMGRRGSSGKDTDFKQINEMI